MNHKKEWKKRLTERKMGIEKTKELLRLKSTFERQLEIFEERKDTARLYPQGRPVFQRKSQRFQAWEENQKNGVTVQPTAANISDKRLVNHGMVKEFKSSIR